MAAAMPTTPIFTHTSSAQDSSHFWVVGSMCGFRLGKALSPKHLS
jgi:hypothetical protein